MYRGQLRNASAGIRPETWCAGVYVHSHIHTNVIEEEVGDENKGVAREKETWASFMMKDGHTHTHRHIETGNRGGKGEGRRKGRGERLGKK